MNMWIRLAAAGEEMDVDDWIKKVKQLAKPYIQTPWTQTQIRTIVW